MLDTMLQYYLHITDTDKLSDDEWCARVTALLEIRKLEADGNGKEAAKLLNRL